MLFENQLLHDYGTCFARNRQVYPDSFSSQ